MNTTITLYDQKVKIAINKGTYSMGNRTALEAVGCEDGDPFGFITVNIPDVPLKANEICVKTWSENSWVLQLLTLLPNNFKDTGKRIPCGYTDAQVWEFKNC